MIMILDMTIIMLFVLITERTANRTESTVYNQHCTFAAYLYQFDGYITYISTHVELQCKQNHSSVKCSEHR